MFVAGLLIFRFRALLLCCIKFNLQNPWRSAKFEPLIQPHLISQFPFINTDKRVEITVAVKIT